jgi:hypothetical protein
LPRGEPWAFELFFLCGAGQPMIDLTAISVGRPASAMPSSIARCSASRSLTSSTLNVCQP